MPDVLNANLQDLIAKEVINLITNCSKCNHNVGFVHYIAQHVIRELQKKFNPSTNFLIKPLNTSNIPTSVTI